MGRAANHLARFQGKRDLFPQWSGRLYLRQLDQKLTDGLCVSMALLCARDIVRAKLTSLAGAPRAEGRLHNRGICQVSNPTANAEPAQEAWVEPQIILLDSKASALNFRNGPDGSSYTYFTRS